VSPRFSEPVLDRTIGRDLRQLRRSANISVSAMQRCMKWSESKVSRVENGRSPLELDQIRDLLDLYGVTDFRREELLSRAARLVMPSGEARNREGMLGAASQLMTWGPQLVPWVLQTTDFAWAAQQAAQDITRAPHDVITRRISSILAQQARLSGDPPLEVQALIGEAALHQRCGTPGVMDAQWEQLLAFSKLPNVAIRILPWDAEAPSWAGAFTYAAFPGLHGLPSADAVLTEPLYEGTVLAIESQVHVYRATFRALWAAARNEMASRDLLRFPPGQRQAAGISLPPAAG